MKSFLLLALTAGLLSPIAAKAETWWLVLNKTAATKIEMESEEQCIRAGKEWQIEMWGKKWGTRNWYCLKGK